MLKLIEDKVAQIKGEMEAMETYSGKMSSEIEKLLSRKKGYDENLIRLGGAMEAFQATLNAMRAQEKADVQNKERQSEVVNAQSDGV